MSEKLQKCPTTLVLHYVGTYRAEPRDMWGSGGGYWCWLGRRGGARCLSRAVSYRTPIRSAVGNWRAWGLPGCHGVLSNQDGQCFLQKLARRIFFCWLVNTGLDWFFMAKEKIQISGDLQRTARTPPKRVNFPLWGGRIVPKVAGFPFKFAILRHQPKN